ncbi:MAG: PEP-CTERM sorting domain-containing protein [Gemmatimonadetes bacterium]|nr:MAG: PEP-CTERM sorting domain-containing protein [Gemmatimonadota bacterium]
MRSFLRLRTGSQSQEKYRRSGGDEEGPSARCHEPTSLGGVVLVGSLWTGLRRGREDPESSDHIMLIS